MNDPNPTIIDCLVLPALAMPLVIAACRFGAWLWRLAGFIDRLLARRPPAGRGDRNHPNKEG